MVIRFFFLYFFSDSDKLISFFDFELLIQPYVFHITYRIEEFSISTTKWTYSGNKCAAHFPLFVLYFYRSQVVSNIITILITITLAPELNSIAWQPKVNVPALGKAKIFSLSNHGAHYFLSWRHCHPLVFAKTGFLCFRAILVGVK